MKEKISCSLDGKIVDQFDDIIRMYPFISSRSALIEMCCVLFINAYDFWDSFDLDKEITYCETSHHRDELIRGMYERRCDWNVQKESKD